MAAGSRDLAGGWRRKGTHHSLSFLKLAVPEKSAYIWVVLFGRQSLPRDGWGVQGSDPKPGGGGLKMRNCLKFLMISRQSAVFNVTLQTSLSSLGEPWSQHNTTTSGTRSAWPKNSSAEDSWASFGENSTSWCWIRLLFQMWLIDHNDHVILEHLVVSA